MGPMKTRTVPKIPAARPTPLAAALVAAIVALIGGGVIAALT